jgi:hypothetical protein
MRSALSMYWERTELNETRIGLRLSEEAAQKLIELAGGERNRSKWLKETIEKMADGWQLVPPDTPTRADFEQIEAHLVLIETMIRRMLKDAGD